MCFPAFKSESVRTGQTSMSPCGLKPGTITLIHFVKTARLVTGKSRTGRTPTVAIDKKQSGGIVGQSGDKWLTVGIERKVREMSKGETNKGEREQGKREGVQVYTHPASNSKPEHLGTAIAIARNMPTFDYKGEIVDEGQRNKLIAEYIEKNGVTRCKQGESGNGNKGLSAWSRISFDSGDSHPLDRQEKEARGNKKKKVKKKVNKRKKASSN